VPSTRDSTGVTIVADSLVDIGSETEHSFSLDPAPRVTEQAPLSLVDFCLHGPWALANLHQQGSRYKHIHT
jgi:hypothetical protein